MKQFLSAEKIEKRKVSYEPIDDVYCQYEDTIETFINGELSNVYTTSSIATIKEILELKDFQNITRKINVDWMYEGFGYIISIKKEIYNKLLQGEIHINNICNDTWEIRKYDPSKYIYCIFNHGAWHLASLDKKAIRYPVFFDYISGGVTDSNYDLPRVLEFMKKDKRFMPALYLKNNNDELNIRTIPYYNADDSIGYHAIEFCYMPETEDEMQKLITLKSLEKQNKIQELLETFKLDNK